MGIKEKTHSPVLRSAQLLHIGENEIFTCCFGIHSIRQQELSIRLPRNIQRSGPYSSFSEQMEFKIYD